MVEGLFALSMPRGLSASIYRATNLQSKDGLYINNTCDNTRPLIDARVNPTRANVSNYSICLDKMSRFPVIITRFDNFCCIYRNINFQVFTFLCTYVANVQKTTHHLQNTITKDF